MHIICSGYRNLKELKFRDETSAVARKVQRQKQVVLKSSPAINIAPTGQRLPDESTSGTGSLQCLKISSYPEELALGYFFFVFSQSGPFLYMLDHTSAIVMDEDIKQAIYAPALASMALEHRNPELLRVARCHYSKALAQTNQDLGDPKLAILDKTLLQVLLLSSFEALVFAGRSTPRNWELHVQGSLKLLVLRQKEQFKTELGRRLFHHASVNILTNCIMRCIPIPEDFLQLHDYVNSGLSGLDHPRAQMVNFICRFARLWQSKRGMLATDFVRECMELDDQAVQMIDSLFERLPFEVIDLTTSDQRRRSPDAKVCVYKNTIHKYESQHSARIYNTARLMRLVIKEWIFCVFDGNSYGLILDQPAIDDPLAADWGGLPIHAVLETSEIVDDMLASVPYSLEITNTPSSSNARALVWPLVNAAASEICPPLARLYIIDQLKGIAVKFNLDQAMHAARMLEERVPLEGWMHLLHLS
ncbi:Ff.00g131250.m01.CDS01 [Fusarium sp. VM40]|nr:Ff.00g131250.m01.CDS01 [Fusarium sp. VM40]